jgi:hypothetical protein
MKAFPSQYNNMTGQTEYGMDLRDWFAGLAMQSINFGGNYLDVPPDVIAVGAYQWADAMLKQREIKADE